MRMSLGKQTNRTEQGQMDSWMERRNFVQHDRICLVVLKSIKQIHNYPCVKTNSHMCIIMQSIVKPMADGQPAGVDTARNIQSIRSHGSWTQPLSLSSTLLIRMWVGVCSVLR